MPLWLIFHPKGTFTDNDSKRAFSQDITKIYTEHLGLPAFYVVAQFIKMPEGDVWVGGSIKADKPFIRLVIEHTAVRLPPDADEEMFKKSNRMINEVLKRHVLDKDYDCEFTLHQTDRRLWQINGLIPPQWKSEEEREWVKANKALPWDGDH